MEEEKKEKSFVVKDRRKFTESGEARVVEEGSGGRKDSEVRAEAIKEDVKSTDKDGRGPSEEAQPPEMDFAGFVLSLSTTAMFHFGDLPDPVTKKAEKNLAAAKQTIDILGMLQEKTAGNLTADEKNILDAVLFELRMRYVKEKI